MGTSVGGGTCGGCVFELCGSCVRAAWCVSLDGGGDERTGCTALEECVQPGGRSAKLIPPRLLAVSSPLSLPSLSGTSVTQGEIRKLR